MDQTALQNIKTRLGYNVKRAENLLSLYNRLASGTDVKYPSDILRSAVVLLHATLEDVIRGLLKCHKLRAKPKDLSDINFYFEEDEDGQGTKSEKRISVSQLAAIVDEQDDPVDLRSFIDGSIKSHFDKRSYGSKKAVKYALITLGLKVGTFENLLDAVEPMMTRRHAIVHQGDRGKIKYGKLEDIEKTVVTRWSKAVKQLVEKAISDLESKDKKPRVRIKAKLKKS